jgi:hypothetical protein
VEQSLAWQPVSVALHEMFLKRCLLATSLSSISADLLSPFANQGSLGYLHHMQAMIRRVCCLLQGRFGKPVGGLICLGLLLIIAVNAIVMSMAANAR